MTELLSDPALLRRLALWIREQVPKWPDADIAVERLSGGSSASLFKLSSGDRHLVLRAPLVPPRPDSLRALGREASVLRALAGTEVPHAKLFVHCEDPSLIGAPFLLTEWIVGWTGSATVPEHLDAPDLAPQWAFALIDALAVLHSVDYRAIGLGGFGRPDGFLHRQVDQWLELFRQHRELPHSRELKQVPIIASWLRENMPTAWSPALIHCDASFSNVMFYLSLPPRVAALVDWEIATVGDPRVDIGRALYPFPDERGLAGVSMAVDHGDGPTRQALAARYEERVGRSGINLDFFMILAMFKLAALIEPNYARDVQGLDQSGFSGRVARFIPQLLDGACSIMGIHERWGERIA